MRRLLFFFTTVLMIAIAPNAGNAADSLGIVVNGQQIQSDVPPQIIKGRTVVPLRFIGEALGMTVDWTSNDRTVTLRNSQVVIVLPVGRAVATVNGQNVNLDVPAAIIEGRTMVPVRFVAETLGAVVRWDDATRTVYIEAQSEGLQINQAPSYNETVQELRALKVDAPADSLTLGARIHNLIIETRIHSLGVEDETQFQAQVKALMFPEDSTLTLHGRTFQSIATLLLDASITDQEAIELLDALYEEWEASLSTPSLSASGSIIVVGSDGQYLGELTSNPYQADSICNPYGSYGSKYSSTSIWNEFGQYGSPYSSKSAFNKLASDPPLLVSDGKVVGYLTTNTLKPGAITPLGICQRLKDAGL